MKKSEIGEIFEKEFVPKKLEHYIRYFFISFKRWER